MNKFKRFRIALVCLLAAVMVAPVLLPAAGQIAAVAKAATVKLNKSQLSLYVGNSYTLKVSGATGTVTWSTSDKAVATVSKGKVTAKKAGDVIITAKVGDQEYKCMVTVTVKGQTTVYGKVTKISGKKVTLALGTLSQPSGTGPNGAAPSGTPAAPSGTPAAPGGTPGASDSSKGQGGGPDMLSLTGKSVTITISDTSILTKMAMKGPDDKSSDSSASLSDIAVGSILKVTYKSSVKNLVFVQIMGGGQQDASKSSN